IVEMPCIHPKINFKVLCPFLFGIAKVGIFSLLPNFFCVFSGFFYKKFNLALFNIVFWGDLDSFV
ncbi:MAG: hypothetical protein ACI4TU_02875, partial [Candidatus Cryptobacteroides sp.]